MTRHARIAPPPLGRWYVDRPRLDGLLAEATGRRLTTVIAGAGYGKSSLVSAWGARTEACWLTVDQADVALGAFAPSVVAALQSRAHNLAIDLRVDPAAGGERESANRADAIAATISASLDRSLETDVALVVDDLNRIPADSPAIRLVEGLVRQAPSRFHMVLLSRSKLPFPIERLRGRGDVLSLEASDLAFLPEEVEALVNASLGTRDPVLALQLHTLSGGWPAGVRLALEAIRGKPLDRRDAILDALRRPEGAIFAYLAEEVFAAEPDTVTAFVQTVSPFSRFSPELAEALGAAGAASIVGDLVHRGLFVRPDEETDGWYRLHELVRRYARERLALQPGQIARLHGLAARWFEANGRLLDAARSFSVAGDESAAGSFIHRHGEEVLRSGGGPALVLLGELIAPGAHDEVDEVVAEAHMIGGNLDAAHRRLQPAMSAQGPLPAGVAAIVGRIHWERGEFAKARDVYVRARLDGSDPRREAMVLAYLANALWALGDAEACRVAADQALAVATACHDLPALAASHNVLAVARLQTDPEAADGHFRQGLEAAGAAGDVFQRIRLLLNFGSFRTDQGHYREGFDLADEAAQLAELAGWPAALAAARKERGLRNVQLGRLEEAGIDIEAARAIWERIGSTRIYLATGALGYVATRRGSLAAARAYLERTVALAEAAGDSQITIFSCTDLARLVARADPARANELAGRALDESRRLVYVLVEPVLVAGWLALERGDRDEAAARAAEAEEAARQTGSTALLPEALQLQALASSDPAKRVRLLDEAVAGWAELGDVLGQASAEAVLGRLAPDADRRARGRRAERRLRELGVRIEAAAETTGVLMVFRQIPPGEIAIRTLGGFEVALEGRPIGHSEWRSKKARDLLKILLARRGRPAAREALMEMLWPDEEPDRLANRLAVALATLRAVLDPTHRFASDRFVSGDQQAVWLRPGALSIDVDVFLADSAGALSLLRTGRSADAQELLEAAEAAYVGDFLEEDPFQDWAVPLREEVRAAYIAVVRALAQAANDRDEVDTCIRYWLRLLERDGFDEDAHLNLVGALVRNGRHGEARRRYRAYVAAMDSIAVEAAPFPDAPGRSSPERTGSGEPVESGA